MTEFEQQLYQRYINSTNYHYIVPFELKKTLYLAAYDAIQLNRHDFVYQYPQEFSIEFSLRHKLKDRVYDFELIEEVLSPLKTHDTSQFIEYDVSDEDLETVKYMSETSFNGESFKMLED